MKIPVIIEISTKVADDASSGYFAGAIIALLICGYLFYALIKPEKF